MVFGMLAALEVPTVDPLEGRLPRRAQAAPAPCARAGSASTSRARALDQRPRGGPRVRPERPRRRRRQRPWRAVRRLRGRRRERRVHQRDQRRGPRGPRRAGPRPMTFRSGSTRRSSCASPWSAAMSSRRRSIRRRPRAPATTGGATASRWPPSGARTSCPPRSPRGRRAHGPARSGVRRLQFIVTPDGRHVFLEVNPSGEFMWLVTHAGLPDPRSPRGREPPLDRKCVSGSMPASATPAMLVDVPARVEQRMRRQAWPSSRSPGSGPARLAGRVGRLLGVPGRIEQRVRAEAPCASPRADSAPAARRRAPAPAPGPGSGPDRTPDAATARGRADADVVLQRRHAGGRQFGGVLAADTSALSNRRARIAPLRGRR